MSLKRDLRFYQDNLIPIESFSEEFLPKVNNIIYENGDGDFQWIEESTKELAEWNNIFRSTYIRWALTINGLHVARDKYNDPKFYENKAFSVGGYINDKDEPKFGNLLVLDGKSAAKAHFDTVNMIASYGIIDLYGLIEECILSLYRIYWNHHPEKMLKGPENKEARMIFREKDNNPEKWNTYWVERLDKWQRKKIFEGIDNIFKGYYTSSGLKIPSSYKDTTLETLSTSLKGVSILRNCLIHGSYNVPKELAEIANQKKVFEFQLNEGDKIELDTKHLMSVEFFIQGLLGAINISLIEFIKDSSEK
jgi:hypothetical protein